MLRSSYICPVPHSRRCSTNSASFSSRTLPLPAQCPKIWLIWISFKSLLQNLSARSIMVFLIKCDASKHSSIHNKTTYQYDEQIHLSKRHCSNLISIRSYLKSSQFQMVAPNLDHVPLPMQPILLFLPLSKAKPSCLVASPLLRAQHPLALYSS